MPNIRILQPGDESLLEAFLLPRIESSMFLLSNLRAAGLEDHRQRYQGTYFAAFEDGRIVGVAAHYWNDNVILQTPVHLTDMLRALCHRAVRPIKGFFGPRDQVDHARQLLELPPDGPGVQMNSDEGLFALDLSRLEVPAELLQQKVTVRAAGPNDCPLMVQWQIEYSIEALGSRVGPELHERCRKYVESSLEAGRLWVVEEERRVVSCSAFNAALPEVVQIGGVWTPKPWRGRHLARCAVAGSLIEARQAGVRRAILFTGWDNVAAVRAYEALGFQRIGDYKLYLLNDPANVPNYQPDARRITPC